METTDPIEFSDLLKNEVEKICITAILITTT